MRPWLILSNCHNSFTGQISGLVKLRNTLVVRGRKRVGKNNIVGFRVLKVTIPESES